MRGGLRRAGNRGRHVAICCDPSSNDPRDPLRGVAVIRCDTTCAPRYRVACLNQFRRRIASRCGSLSSQTTDTGMTDMRRRRHHLNADFEVWTGQWIWFWRVVSPHRDGGTIGAAATEAAAILEACISIEERSAPSSTSPATERVVAESSAMPPFYRSRPLAALAWEGSLASLQRYLTGLRGEIAGKNVESSTCAKSSTPATGR
jgi:hypothetical protein